MGASATASASVRLPDGRYVTPTVLGAFGVALTLEKAYDDAMEQIRHDTGRCERWWVGGCAEASVALRDDLLEKLPSAEAEYVWGDFLVTGRGWLSELHGDGDDDRWGHAWVALGPSDRPPILDMTLGQFTGGRPMGLVLPEDDLYAHYRERDRPPWV